jgi:hypothetical protein
MTTVELLDALTTSLQHPSCQSKEAKTMTEHQDAEWNDAAWHGKMLVDRDREKIGKLQDG